MNRMPVSLDVVVAARRQFLCTSNLRIDNSRRGAVHVLWNFSRTQIATTSCDISIQKISRKNTIFSFIWLYFFK